MAVMHLILQETPWKISMQNLHFWDQHQKLKDDWHPHIWPGSHLNFFSSDLACTWWKMIDPPVLTSGGNLGNSSFACTLQWCMQICHKPVAHYLRVMWKCSFTVFSIVNVTFEMAVMHLILQETPWKISMQNLHFWDQHQKLKDDWHPHIWPGSHLNFFSSDLACTWWKMIDPPVLTSGGNLGNSTFACTLQWCMQICHKPVAHYPRVMWKCSFTVFSIVNAHIKIFS